MTILFFLLLEIPIAIVADETDYPRLRKELTLGCINDYFKRLNTRINSPEENNREFQKEPKTPRDMWVPGHIYFGKYTPKEGKFAAAKKIIYW